MIVIERNGRTTVITGWRAWLVGVALFVGATLLIGFIAFVALGVALTLTAILLIVVPVAVAVGLLASLFRGRR
jgi:hypothetical protein